ENPYLEEVEGNEDSRSNQHESAASGSDEAVNNIEQQIFGGVDDGRGIDDFISRFADSLTKVDERTQSASDEFQTPLYDVIQVDDSDSLHEDIEEQLRMMHLTTYELDCAVMLVQYLDDNGYMATDLAAV